MKYTLYEYPIFVQLCCPSHYMQMRWKFNKKYTYKTETGSTMVKYTCTPTDCTNTSNNLLEYHHGWDVAHRFKALASHRVGARAGDLGFKPRRVHENLFSQIRRFMDICMHFILCIISIHR